jgi:hypothetical protein
MGFTIFGGNTKRNPEAKMDLRKNEEYSIPSGMTHAYIRGGKICFGRLVRVSIPKRIRYFVGGGNKIIKMLKTQRVKFVELIPEANSISFPDWDGTAFTQIEFHTDNSTILFLPVVKSPVSTPISQRIIPFPQRIIPY